ncbi:hypothetical protein C8Q79DRAFT_927973 [Trametes meyenii]|nr:hypothetical protein C8Q79DRAFT_927973 [Trametes meyenii]
MYGDRDAHVFASSLAPHLSPKYIPRLHTLALRGIGTDGMAYLNTLAPAPSAFSALTSTYHRHMRDVQSLLSPTTLPYLAHLHLHAITWFMPDYNNCDRDDVTRTPSAHSLRALGIPPKPAWALTSSTSSYLPSRSTTSSPPSEGYNYMHLETLALSMGMDDVFTRHDTHLPDLLTAVTHNPVHNPAHQSINSPGEGQSASFMKESAITSRAATQNDTELQICGRATPARYPAQPEYDCAVTPARRAPVSNPPLVHSQNTKVADDEPSAQQALFRLLGQDLDIFAEAHADSYEQARRKWAECSAEEWTKGADELMGRFSKMLDFVKDHMMCVAPRCLYVR